MSLPELRSCSRPSRSPAASITSAPSITSITTSALALLALAALPGCGAGDDFDERLGTAQQEEKICAGPNTVQGIDVSYYQPNINWTKVANSGRKFAIARVSDGFFNDPDFEVNWAGIKAAGMIRGTYQFFRPGKDAAAQADLVIQKVGVLGPGDLPVTLDVEATDGQSAATIAAKIHTWVDKVTAGTGKKPIIYTGKYFWNDNVVTADFADYPLWIAAYGPPCPDTPIPWHAWAMWQYSSTGSVPGISGDCDLDVFNGTLDDLNALANGGADWGAKFVAQSFPYAVDPLVMTVNQSLAATLEMKNIGKQAWDGNTRLATTQPRDRASDFHASDWLAPNRLAAVDGTVAPGDSYTFKFTFKAPNKPGTYYEYFGMVQEGVHWFSDPGQAGPPDDQLEAQIQVIAAEYQAEVVQSSFPGLDEAPVEMAVGATLDGWIDLKNVGTATWKAGETKLAPTPRDQTSALADASWLSPTRVSTLDADVPPGEVGHFKLAIHADKKDDVVQTFGLVEEGVTWFADAPKGGGPADDALGVHVIASAAIPDIPLLTPGGSGTGGGGGNDMSKGPCSCRAGSAPSSPGSVWLGLGLMGMTAMRRRNRRR
ncbi:MAG: GH25 family lysozyme [Byssovorax sp.]